MKRISDKEIDTLLGGAGFHTNGNVLFSHRTCGQLSAQAQLEADQQQLDELEGDYKATIEALESKAGLELLAENMVKITPALARKLQYILLRKYNSTILDNFIEKINQIAKVDENDFDYELLAPPCQYGAAFAFDTVDCGKPAIYKVWWDEHLKDAMNVCEKHFRWIKKCEGADDAS